MDKQLNRRGTTLLTLLARAAMVAAGVGIMWLEGRAQPAPGVGFAVALMFILGAALPWRRG